MQFEKIYNILALRKIFTTQFVYHLHILVIMMTHDFKPLFGSHYQLLYMIWSAPEIPKSNSNRGMSQKEPGVYVFRLGGHRRRRRLGLGQEAGRPVARGEELPLARGHLHRSDPEAAK